MKTNLKNYSALLILALFILGISLWTGELKPVVLPAVT